MVKFLKPGKVVIVTSGRQAGRKAVIVRNYDDGTGSRKFSHALVAGVERYPLKVTRDMSEKKIRKRIRIRPFVKFVNYAHLMPTRYNVDFHEELRRALPESLGQGTADDPWSTLESRRTCRIAVKKLLEERYLTGKNQWFFTKLRF
jgi:large subunit ribosomal protein L27e